MNLSRIVLVVGCSCVLYLVFVSDLRGADIRMDHPRLYFNAETQESVIQRALYEEKPWYDHIKSRVDPLLSQIHNLPSKGARNDEVGEIYDYGQESAWSAFIYLAEKDPRYLELAIACMEQSLDYYEECYSKRVSVNWRTYTRIHVAMTWDWLFNDLSEPARSEYMFRLIHVINNVKNARPFISREHISGYDRGMYGIMGALWPVAATAYGTGIEPELVEEWLNVSRKENMRMLDYRIKYVGDDGGGSSPSLGYVANWYPYADWNFYYTMLSATGEDLLEEISYNRFLPNYIFWNLLPSNVGPRQYGYGDASKTIGEDRWIQKFLYTNMSVIQNLFGRQYPDTAAVAEHLKHMLPAEYQTWKDDYFIYPFLSGHQSVSDGKPIELDLNKLPRARHFEKMGQVFMSSGFKPEDVYCLFACGGDLDHHRHYDALHFTIYSKDSFLAIDSGDRYDEFTNRPHLLNYYSQSVAHNTILVHQPGEPPTTYWDRKLEVMDGGQHRIEGSEIKAFETNDHYVYVAGDATDCYMHGGPLPEKVSLVTRQMVFVPPKHFVIFDRVTSTRPDYPKTWLLHTINKPQVYSDNYFYADRGNRRLFCKTFLPENADISTVGGKGMKFWSGGRNWPIVLPEDKDEEFIAEAGRWRVEVKPKKQRRQDYFLHVLEVTGQNAKQMTNAKLMKTRDGYGVAFNNVDGCWQVCFNKTGPLGGKISCTGGVNLSQDLTQKVQPQSGIYKQSPKQTMTYEQAIKRIPERQLPDFWMVDAKKIGHYLSELKKGTVRKLAKSAGDRDLYVVTYGEFEPMSRLTNFNSAVGAQEPQVYCDKDKREKPVILFVGPVHGHEVEGLVGLMNLIRIMETGKDLRGKEHPQLRQAGEQCRLVIIPCGNPDGLARFKPKSLQNMEFIDMRFWGQGTWSDNTLCGWPQSKRQHPMKGENCGFLGCYFNDDGINMMHDEFYAPMSPEVPAMLDLVRAEAPDLAVSLHSHQRPPALLCPAYVPEEIKKDIQELSADYTKRLETRNIPYLQFKYKHEKGAIPPSCNFTSAMYHTSGARVFTFESPHGIAGKKFEEFRLEDMLDIQLILYEAMMDYELHLK